MCGNVIKRWEHSSKNRVGREHMELFIFYKKVLVFLTYFSRVKSEKLMSSSWNVRVLLAGMIGG